jgi:glycine dehydrogenase
MGGAGLTHATEVAILNANYVAHRLKNYFPILYTGSKNLIAHECILDIREITKDSGVGVDDIAKRLMDFGFHAPTMSFPVAGTLMIEPTESEDILEMNRFIDAMIAIKYEIDEIIEGKLAIDESPLRNAPHTIGAIASSHWDHAYSRERAAFPATFTGLIPGELIGQKGKYWPTTGRIDGAFGDRNLVCSCPPIESFA